MSPTLQMCAPGTGSDVLVRSKLTKTNFSRNTSIASTSSESSSSGAMSVLSSSSSPLSSSSGGKYKSANIHKNGSIPKRQLYAPRVLERVRTQAEELVELWSFQKGMRFVREKSNKTLVYELNGTSLPSSSLVGRSFNETNRPQDYQLVKGVTSIRAPSLQHVMEQLSANNSDQFERLAKQLFGKLLIRAVILPEESQAGALVPEDDQFTAQWMALRPLGSMTTTEYNRDFTFVSYQDFYQRSEVKNEWVRLGKSSGVAKLRAPASSSLRSSTKIVGVHLFSSCSLSGAPILPKSAGTDRLNFRNTGFIVEETIEPKVFRISMFVSIEPTSWTLKNTKKFHKWLYKIAGSIGNLESGRISQTEPEPEVVGSVSSYPQRQQSADQSNGPLVRGANNNDESATYPHFEVIVDENRKKMIDVVLLPSKKWEHQPNCRKCQKAFHTFRRCHHCRFCGLSICQKCSSFITLSDSKGFQVRMLGASMGNSVTEAQTRTSRSASTSTNNSSNTNGTPSTTSKTKKTYEASQVTFAVAQSTYVSTSNSSGSSSDDKINPYLLVDTRGCSTCVSELNRMVETKETLTPAASVNNNNTKHDQPPQTKRRVSESDSDSELDDLYDGNDIVYDHHSHPHHHHPDHYSSDYDGETDDEPVIIESDEEYRTTRGSVKDTTAKGTLGTSFTSRSRTTSEELTLTQSFNNQASISTEHHHQRRRRSSSNVSMTEQQHQPQKLPQRPQQKELLRYRQVLSSSRTTAIPTKATTSSRLAVNIQQQQQQKQQKQREDFEVLEQEAEDHFHFSLMSSRQVSSRQQQVAEKQASHKLISKKSLLDQSRSFNKKRTYGSPNRPHPSTKSGTDMILLSSIQGQMDSSEFVFFSDNSRESMMIRPEEGHDMIPLNL